MLNFTRLRVIKESGYFLMSPIYEAAGLSNSTITSRFKAKKPSLSTDEAEDLTKVLEQMRQMVQVPAMISINFVRTIHESGFFNMKRIYEEAGQSNTTIYSRFEMPEPFLTTDEATALSNIFTVLHTLISDAL